MPGLGTCTSIPITFRSRDAARPIGDPVVGHRLAAALAHDPGITGCAGAGAHHFMTSAWKRASISGVSMSAPRFSQRYAPTLIVTGVAFTILIHPISGNCVLEMARQRYWPGRLAPIL